MKPKEVYRRNLPHINPPGGTFFVTYNLDGSIPKDVIIRLQEEYRSEKEALLSSNREKEHYHNLRKKHLYTCDKYLDSYVEGPHYLKNKKTAEEVVKSLLHWDNKKLELICYCIMSNHVHVVMRLFKTDENDDAVYLQKILQSIKRYSAYNANKINGLTGQFWQRESFDYLVKDREELFRIIEYVLNNPVKAGLCKNRNDWKWSYIKPEYNEFV